jgi:hypothetical protein
VCDGAIAQSQVTQRTRPLRSAPWRLLKWDSVGASVALEEVLGAPKTRKRPKNWNNYAGNAIFVLCQPESRTTTTLPSGFLGMRPH